MKKFLCFISVFVLCLTFAVVPSYALTVEPLPDFNYVPQGNTTHPNSISIFYLDNNNIPTIYQFLSVDVLSVDSYIVNKDAEESLIYYKVDKASKLVRWQRNNNNKWATVGYTTDVNYGNWGYVTAKELYRSDFDIRENADSDVLFFPQPPVVPEETTLAEVVTAEMSNFQNKTVGTMKILMACGVGLIALLVALNLFGKVLRNFQVK